MLHLHATFGDALLHTHRALIANLRAFLQEIQDTSVKPPEELADQLEIVREEIQDHFRCEEENGYMASVLEFQPHLDRAVQRLLEEHKQLLGSLDELIAQVRSESGLTPDVREAVLGWVRKIRRHEEHENALLQDAFNVEMGPED